MTKNIIIDQILKDELLQEYQLRMQTIVGGLDEKLQEAFKEKKNNMMVMKLEPTKGDYETGFLFHKKVALTNIYGVAKSVMETMKEVGFTPYIEQDKETETFYLFIKWKIE